MDKLSEKEHYDRRYRAWKLRDKGLRLSEVAEIMGLSWVRTRHLSERYERLMIIAPIEEALGIKIKGVNLIQKQRRSKPGVDVCGRKDRKKGA